MIKSRICELLGIKHPVFQGGMIHIATWELVAAVSEAGGLGTIGCGSAPAEWVRDQIAKTREKTKKPFAVNVLLLSPHSKDIIELVISEGVKVVTLGAGIPRKEIPKLKAAGITVMPVVGSSKFAALCERLGADAVIAEGMESGGEIGDMATMPLIPQVVDAVKIPVVAAGGFADGRGLAAAFALGAEGIQMGTRFVASVECIAHQNMKNAIVQCEERDTRATCTYVGTPMRALKNKLTREFERLEKEFIAVPGDDERMKKRQEIWAFGTGATRRGLIEGDVETGSLLAGQISGMIGDVKTVREIIDGIVKEAEEIMSGRLPGRVA